jgi:hypothetical protein
MRDEIDKTETISIGQEAEENGERLEIGEENEGRIGKMGI